MTQPSGVGPPPGSSPDAAVSNHVLEIRRRKLPATPKFPSFTPHPFTSWSGWDSPTVVRAALSEHERGRFDRTAQILDAMMRDDRFAGILGTRIHALIGSETSFPVGSTSGDGGAENESEELEDLYPVMCPRGALYDLLRWGLGLGVGIGELLWDTESKQGWVPMLRTWHPRYLRFDITDRYYYLNTQQGEIRIEPGNGQWVLFTPYGYEQGFIHGLIRRCAMMWQARQWALRDWARWSEAHGLPMMALTIPPKFQEDDLERLQTQLTQRGSDMLVSLMKFNDGTGYDLKLIEATSTGWDGFQGLIERCDTNLAVAILGQNLTTEVKAGSFAAARVQDTIRMDILDADGRALEECLNDQVVRPWARFNLGERGLGQDSQPRVRFNTQPPADAAEKGEALSALGAGITALQGAGVQVDVDELVEQADVPVSGPAKTKDEMDAEAAAKQAAANPDVGGIKTPTTKGAGPVPPRLQAASETSSMLGAIAGQGRLDRLGDDVLEDAARVLTPDRLKLLACVAKAKDPDELRRLVEATYQGMDPTQLANVLMRAWAEAELVGLWSQR